MSDIINRHPPPYIFSTAGLIPYSSIVYLFAKPLELLVHRLGSPKSVIVSISRCSDLFCYQNKFHGYSLQSGYFLVKYKFMN